MCHDFGHITEVMEIKLVTLNRLLAVLGGQNMNAALKYKEMNAL